MSTSNVICDAVRDALVSDALTDLHHQHIAGCATCKGLIKMTESIGTELSNVPAVAGQRPQWIAELHARDAKRRKRIIWGSAGLGLATPAALAIVLLRPATQATTAGKRSEQPAGMPAPAPHDVHSTEGELLAPKPAYAPHRPDWVTPDKLFMPHCTLDHGITCIGSSTYRPTKAEARSEAIDAALDALAGVVGDRIDVAEFGTIRRIYEKVRQPMVAAYVAKATEGDVPATDATYRELAAARHRAAQSFQLTAPAILPPAPSDWYWEEFAKDDGTGTEFVGYVKYTIDATQLQKLIELYSTVRLENNEPGFTTFPLLLFALSDATKPTIKFSLVAGSPTNSTPPQNVPPSLLEGSRIAGEQNIVPDDVTKTEISRSGTDRIIGSFKMCIDTSGAVTEVKTLKPTGFAAYDTKIVGKMKTEWRYKPYMVNGAAAPVCTAVTFIYTQK